jgi:ABC-type nickel/cobalt efflux system permease component RcnA
VLALFVALGLGALHALAPGHGKTIMAAQAAGQGRRSRREALALGLTVTATHTAGVLALGLLVASGSAVASPALFPWLGAACGAIVALAGLTLLRRALRNRRDHHHHHHHHGHGHGHGHGHHHHHHAPARRRNVLLMGLAGGLMPSPSAVVVLLGASALGHAWFGLLLVLAYGAGLALTLVTIGVLVTGTGRMLARRLPAIGERVRAAPALLPAGTAALVILLGLGLAARSLVSLTA